MRLATSLGGRGGDTGGTLLAREKAARFESDSPFLDPHHQHARFFSSPGKRTKKRTLTRPLSPLSLHHQGSLLPIREKGNWLMCTLLIANTVANVFLPILVASFAGGLVGFITSTILILLLAEIVPQV